jgi:hypothetical protein
MATENDDILEELRDWIEIIDGVISSEQPVSLMLLSSDVHRDAANEIERLRDIGDRLVNAIEDHAWLNVDALIGEWEAARRG